MNAFSNGSPCYRARAALSSSIIGLSLALPSLAQTETLPPLDGKPAPAGYKELWSGFDPRKEPLDVEILNEWEEDDVVMRVLRYRIGVFKGQKAMMAGVYGFPKGGSKLPALLNLHGGGQYADYRAVLTNAKRGYATLTIAWAGRIAAPNYTVNSDIVRLFWDGKKDDPRYKLTTDWGLLDAYHAPCRNSKNGFAFTKPQSWTLDAVDSPRNNPWFLVTLGARRGLTFLEQQAEVDADRLGVYGHSMGGKLTILTTAADSRVKASAPSCGGVSNHSTGDPLFDATVADNISLERISCPTIFLSPSNDFHGRIDDLQTAVTEIKSKEWRVVCSPHHNHQDTAPYMISGLLWMDQFLKRSFTFPKTPQTTLTLNTANGVPSISVTLDNSKPALSVDVYYTQDGQMDGRAADQENAKRRFWHHAKPTRNGNSWTAKLPLESTEKPLWVYANALYPLDHPQTGASYYYGTYTAENFAISSLMDMVTPENLEAEGVTATFKPTKIIETFEGDWEKEWFTYKPENWGRHTLKVRAYQAPNPNSKLILEVRSEKTNTMVVGLDNYQAEIQLKGGNTSQVVVLSKDDFKDAVGNALPEWKGIKELRLLPEGKVDLRTKSGKKTTKAGGKWQGDHPQFQDLQWSN